MNRIDFFKISQESDEEAKHEIEPPKKRGRGRKPKPKAEHAPKNDIEKDELSANSDEVSVWERHYSASDAFVKYECSLVKVKFCFCF